LLRIGRHGDSVGPGLGRRECVGAARGLRGTPISVHSGGRRPSRSRITEDGSSEGPTCGPRREGRGVAVPVRAPLARTGTLLLGSGRRGAGAAPGLGRRECVGAARGLRGPPISVHSGGRRPSRSRITENGSSEGPTCGPRRKGRAMTVLMTAPLLLTVTLLLSGLAKLGARQGTEEAMTSLRLPLRPLHRTVATVLPVAEIVLALVLWIPSVPLQTAVAAVIALLMIVYLV